MNWEVTKPGVEWFFPGKHLQSADEEWKHLHAKNPFDKSHQYIPDTLVYSHDDISCPKAFFHVKYLSHDTTPEYAADILKNGGFFKASTKKKLDCKLIWWGLSLDETEINKASVQFKSYTDSVCEEKYRWPFVDSRDEDCARNESSKEELYDNFMSSPPFSYDSRYGNIRFTYSVGDILNAYKSQYCNNQEPSYLVMGTFVYRMEIMHAIMVCPPTHRMEFPTAQLSSSSVIFNKGDCWIWKPDSTGSILKRPTERYPDFAHWGFRRWEHAAFAFYIPDDSENQMLQLDNINMHISYCPPGECFRWHTSPFDRKEFSFSDAFEYLLGEKTPLQTLLHILHKHLERNMSRPCRDQGENMKIEPGHVKLLFEKLPENVLGPVFELAEQIKSKDAQMFEIVEMISHASSQDLRY